MVGVAIYLSKLKHYTQSHVRQFFSRRSMKGNAWQLALLWQENFFSFRMRSVEYYLLEFHYFVSPNLS